MPNGRKKGRTKLAGKYVARRLALAVLALAVVAGGCMVLGYRIAQSEKEPASQGSSAQPEPRSSEPEPEQLSEPDRAEEESVPEAKPVKADEWNLILVNKERPLPEDFQVELEKVVGDFKVDRRILEPLLKMLAAAREDGISLIVCSAHRTVEKQAANFESYMNNLISKGKTEEEAYAETAREINPPGSSEHHTGLAVDIVTKDYQALDPGFAGTPAFEWLSLNAEKYGFVLRYPEDKTDITDIDYEPWHYRYVGAEHAAAMNGAGYCLEEYVRMLEQGSRPDTGEPTDGADAGTEDPAGASE